MTHDMCKSGVRSLKINIVGECWALWESRHSEKCRIRSVGKSVMHERSVRVIGAN